MPIRKNRAPTLQVQKFFCNWKTYTQTTIARAPDQEDFIVINVDADYTPFNWCNCSSTAYFTQQFLTILSLLDAETNCLMQVQADADYFNWSQLVRDAAADYRRYNWGIYEPQISRTNWYSASVDLLRLPGNRAKIICSDCTAWFIHRDILNYFKALNLDLSNNKYGWGIDAILSTICHELNRPIIRNYNHLVGHPDITNYNNFDAQKEMLSLLKTIPEYLRQHLHPELKSALIDHSAHQKV